MALSEASALVPIENVSLNVTLHVPGHFSENVVVNGSNRLITHTFQVGRSLNNTFIGRLVALSVFFQHYLLTADLRRLLCRRRFT